MSIKEEIKQVLFIKFTIIFTAALFSVQKSSANSAEQQHFNLNEQATSSLKANILELPSGSYLMAGQNQFATLWTRDFAYSVRGLILLGRIDTVRSHIEKLLSLVRPSDGLVPKVMDSVNPSSRVARFSARLIFRFVKPYAHPSDPLKAFYEDENGSQAIDSNVLILLAALDYVDATGDTEWLNTNAQILKKVYDFYERHKDSRGLIFQKDFSDWQDSVRRKGYSFQTNLLYYEASRRLQEYSRLQLQALPESQNDFTNEFQTNISSLRRMKENLLEVFFDPTKKLFRTLENEDRWSLESQLLAIETGFVEGAEAQSLYKNVKNSELWQNSSTGLPGRATYPGYLNSQHSLAVRVAGLTGYHSKVYWSWLMAYAAKISVDMKDIPEAEKVLDVLSRLFKRDGNVGEIYSDSAEMPLWKSRLYRAERPFSWGAAYTLSAYNTLQNAYRKISKVKNSKAISNVLEKNSINANEKKSNIRIQYSNACNSIF